MFSRPTQLFDANFMSKKANLFKNGVKTVKRFLFSAIFRNIYKGFHLHYWCISGKMDTKFYQLVDRFEYDVSNELGVINMAKAQVGDIIEFKDGLTGVVEKINENSVIVDLTLMENFKSLALEEKTVVNHKNYKVIHTANEEK